MEKVLKYIREQRLLRAGDRVAIACSGGADSVALLRILLELREELGIVLSVAHFHHQIRGAEKLDDDDTSSGKLVLNDRNKVVFGENASGGSDIPEVGMEPVVDVTFERHDGAGETENRKEDRGDEAEVEVDFKDDRAQSHGLLR